MQRRDEFRFRLDPVDRAIEACLGQMPGQQLGIRHAVFYENSFNWIFIASKSAVPA
ncbi:MAG: hypothetical protein ABI145_20265 [Steroidobacteraceae bacterium]